MCVFPFDNVVLTRKTAKSKQEKNGHKKTAWCVLAWKAAKQHVRSAGFVQENHFGPFWLTTELRWWHTFPILQKEQWTSKTHRRRQTQNFSLSTPGFCQGAAGKNAILVRVDLNWEFFHVAALNMFQPMLLVFFSGEVHSKEEAWLKGPFFLPSFQLRSLPVATLGSAASLHEHLRLVQLYPAHRESRQPKVQWTQKLLVLSPSIVSPFSMCMKDKNLHLQKGNKTPYHTQTRQRYRLLPKVTGRQTQGRAYRKADFARGEVPAVDRLLRFPCRWYAQWCDVFSFFFLNWGRLLGQHCRVIATTVNTPTFQINQNVFFLSEIKDYVKGSVSWELSGEKIFEVRLFLVTAPERLLNLSIRGWMSSLLWGPQQTPQVTHNAEQILARITETSHADKTLSILLVTYEILINVLNLIFLEVWSEHSSVRKRKIPFSCQKQSKMFVKIELFGKVIVSYFGSTCATVCVVTAEGCHTRSVTSQTQDQGRKEHLHCSEFLSFLTERSVQ